MVFDKNITLKQHWKTDVFCEHAVEIHSVHSKLKCRFEEHQMIELLSETNILLGRGSITFSRGSSESPRRALLVFLKGPPGSKKSNFRQKYQF